MFGFGFAMVPFYRALCEVTGLNSVVEVRRRSRTRRSTPTRSLTMEFDANLRNDLPWTFTPAGEERAHPSRASSCR